MSDLAHRFGAEHCGIAAAVVVAALAATMACAWSQAMQPAPAQQKSVIIQVAPAPASQPPPPAAALTPAPLAEQAPPAITSRDNPGLFNEIGKLFKDTPSLVPSWSLPSLGTGSLTGTIIKGRVVCPIAANGAPDCKAASEKLCQSKGYKDGKSVDTDAAQTCSARTMIPGRKAEEGDCRTDNYVTQALCQ
jgi:hypothetical protein